ncbi:rhodanese-like domain-containing protein [Flexivirga sp. B27]
MTITAPAEMSWQSELFAARPAAHRSTSTAQSAATSTVQQLSPRAAFQELLWQRGTLLDIRPPALRAADGDAGPGVPAGSMHRAQVTEAPAGVPGRRIIVLCHDGSAAPAVAEALASSGARQVAHVVGGFAAWRALGLPVRG